MDLGFQVDPVASATSASIMIGSVWGYMNMINFSKMRQRRDNEAQMLRNAKILVLDGKMDHHSYERAVADAERSAHAYEAARRVPLLRRPRLLRIRASVSSLPAQAGEQDDQDELLQDFKDHLDRIDAEDGPSSST